MGWQRPILGEYNIYDALQLICVDAKQTSLIDSMLTTDQLIFSALAMVGFVSALAALTPETKNMGIAFTIIGPFVSPYTYAFVQGDS